MQELISEKPYRFVPPYRGRFWVRLLQPYLPRYLNRTWGIEAHELGGVEYLKSSVVAGHGILLAPNHCRPCDPLVVGLLSPSIGKPLHAMASWHLFMNGGFKAWLIRRLGAFSVYREGMDREALKASINMLVEADRPLLIFPEGIISRANDRLGTLQEGVAFIARSAARQRAKATPPGKVVIHPVALRYYFEGDLVAKVTPVLDEIETRLSWRPQRQLPLVERIYKVGEALLSLKEIEYLGRAQLGTIPERLPALIDHLLVPLEVEWLGGHRPLSVVERVKQLRLAIVPDLVAREITEEERARRWRQLADIYLAQQLALYPGDYLGARATPERLLETVERFEEDLTDEARVHRPLRVVIQVGPAIEVSPARDKVAGGDPLLKEVELKLLEMLRLMAKAEPTAQTAGASP
jgi:1-acyl-sn-glycerol-3-phosphate acyltransferase